MQNLVNPGKLDLPRILQRLKSIGEHLKEPGEFFTYLEAMAQNSSELQLLSGIFDFDPQLKNATGVVFGDFELMHERISGRPGSFPEMVEYVAANPGSRVKIGVTRHNFFCLDRLAAFAAGLRKRELERKVPAFDIFPVNEVIRNFASYAAQVKQAAEPAGIEFVLADEALIEILGIVNFHARRGKVSDKGLVRLLGIVCENVFIGPQTMVFDPFHRCNIKCKHCFVHNPLIHHGQEFLNRKFDLDTFRRIIDDAAEMKVDNIILQGDGEPFLYEKFFDMLNYASGKGIGVSFFTNGTLLGPDKTEAIVDMQIREIFCSLPAGTRETYANVTTIDNPKLFDDAVNNMTRLMQVKRQKGASRPRLIMTHVIHTLNHHELVQMAQTDARIGTDATRFYLIRLDDNNKHLKLSDEELAVIKRDLPKAAEILRGSGIDFVDNIFFQLEHYDNSSGAWSKDIFLKEGCTIGWYFMLVPALCDVSMCCHLRTTGYLNKQTFKELWNSREYYGYRLRAKFLKENRDFTFLNGVKLYDEHCDHCDNHQTLLANLKDLKELGLYKFTK